MAVLTVIIMLLLSITVGVALKHWELLNDVRGDDMETRESVEDEIDANSDRALMIESIFLDEDDNTIS